MPLKSSQAEIEQSFSMGPREKISFQVFSNCPFPTTSSVSFLDVTSYINGEQSSHISGNAKCCYFKYIVIIKQSCCSLHPSIFYSLFRLLYPPPTEKKMEIALAMLLNLNWTITWNCSAAQWMTKHLVQAYQNAAQTTTSRDELIKYNSAILSLELYTTGHREKYGSQSDKLDVDTRKLTLGTGIMSFIPCAPLIITSKWKAFYLHICLFENN